jgi:hypothetical protein
MLKLLNKTIGKPFYQQHVGLFLIVGYLMFGMIQGYALIEFHIALLNSICTSFINLLMVFTIWTLYTLKAVHFVKQKIASPQYQFAQLLSVLSTKQQRLIWIRIYILLAVPVLGYGGLILFTALKTGEYLAFISTLTWLLLLIYSASWYTTNLFVRSFIHREITIKRPVLKFKKPFWIWPLINLFNQPLIFVVAKGISFLFFNVILLVFADVGNDIRVFLTAMLAVVLSHAMVVANLVKFDAFELACSKSLPIPMLRRIANWGVTFSLILSPELILLFLASDWNFEVLGYGAFFVLSSLFLLKILLYVLKGDFERFFKCLLFFFFIAMFAILAGFYCWFCLLLVALTLAFYRLSYRKLDFRAIA